MNPKFLSVEQVIQIHTQQIDLYGGSHGVRDEGLLESATAMPCATFSGQFLHADLHEMAAAYLYHLVMNHPFVDGKKRAGTAAALVFLHANGLVLPERTDELYELVIAVTEGRAAKPELAAFFRAHGQPRAG